MVPPKIEAPKEPSVRSYQPVVDSPSKLTVPINERAKAVVPGVSGR